jgi:hypothetical protein
MPSEVQHVLTELATTNTELLAIENRAKILDISLRKLMRNDTNPLYDNRRVAIDFPEDEDQVLPSIQKLASGIIKGSEEQVKIYNQIQEEYRRSKEIMAERIELVERIQDLVLF